MVVTISSWLNFGRPAPPGRGLRRGEIFLAPPYYSQRAVFASLWALFFIPIGNWLSRLITVLRYRAACDSQQLRLTAISVSRLLRLVTETTHPDGECIISKWCLEQRHDDLVEGWRWWCSVAVSGQHPWPCTQDHLHHHRNCRSPGQPVRSCRLHLIHQDHWQGIRNLTA